MLDYIYNAGYGRCKNCGAEMHTNNRKDYCSMLCWVTELEMDEGAARANYETDYPMGGAPGCFANGGYW